MFLYIQWVWTSCMFMVGPYSHVVSLLSLDPCDMTLITDFDIAYEPDDSRSCSKHFFTCPYHPGSTEILKFRIFLNALPQSSKIMILREIEIKGVGDCYKLILTVIFSRSFPDWSDPKGVCASISSLWVEKYVLQVAHTITYFLLGVRLNRDTIF